MNATPTAPTERTGTPTATPYVPTSTLATILACHPKTIRSLAQRGLIPQPLMLGGLRRWHLADVLQSLGMQPQS
jgi:hypothetical protein